MADLDTAAVLRYPLFQDDFGEPGDRILSDRVSVARKPHSCFECLGAINAGEQQRVHVAVCDGDIRTYRFCVGCCEAMSKVFDDDADDDDIEGERDNPMEARWEIRRVNESATAQEASNG